MKILDKVSEVLEKTASKNYIAETRLLKNVIEPNDFKSRRLLSWSIEWYKRLTKIGVRNIVYIVYNVEYDGRDRLGLKIKDVNNYSDGIEWCFLNDQP